MPLSTERKAEYFTRMKSYLGSYTKAFIVDVDNVGSQQLQLTRRDLRGRAEILMGKNTMMRKIIREYVEENPDSPAALLEEQCRGNIGFVFTNGDLTKVREILESNVRPAPARVGGVAPSTVIVPKGPTGCDPGQTNFFQTLQIATKITKGQIEIVNDIELVKTGEKVTASQAALLQKLNICPFTYGLGLKAVYDNGSVFDAKVLDITEDVLLAKFAAALSIVTSVSLALGYPTQASVPHIIANAFKAIVAITVGCDNYSFDKANSYKEYLKDPSKFAVASSGPAAAASSGGAAPAAAKEEEKEEEEEMDLGGGLDMFGGGGAAAGGGGGDY